MKNKIFIIFFSLIFCFIVLSCSGIFNNSKFKVSVGDVILSNGYRVPVDYVEDFYWDYLSNNDVLGIVYSIPADGSYMVICPKPNAVENETTWVKCYYDVTAEYVFPVPEVDVPYLWKIDTGDSCGIDNWDVIKTELVLSEEDIYFQFLKR